jgi:hypothetical protein
MKFTCQSCSAEVDGAYLYDGTFCAACFEPELHKARRLARISVASLEAKEGSFRKVLVCDECGFSGAENEWVPDLCPACGRGEGRLPHGYTTGVEPIQMEMAVHPVVIWVPNDEPWSATVMRLRGDS